MSGAVQVEQVQALVEDLRAYRTLTRGGHPTICDEAAETLEALLSELATAQRERDEAYEECARICEKQQKVFASPQYATGQPAHLSANVLPAASVRRKSAKPREAPMPTDPAQVAAVAGGLTKAQRGAVLTAKWRERDGAWWPDGYYIAPDMRVRRSLARDGIIRDYLRPLQRLTELGLAVRAHLLAAKEQSHA